MNDSLMKIIVNAVHTKTILDENHPKHFTPCQITALVVFFNKLYPESRCTNTGYPILDLFVSFPVTLTIDKQDYDIEICSMCHGCNNDCFGLKCDCVLLEHYDVPDFSYLPYYQQIIIEMKNKGIFALMCLSSFMTETYCEILKKHKAEKNIYTERISSYFGFESDDLNKFRNDVKKLLFKYHKNNYGVFREINGKIENDFDNNYYNINRVIKNM